MWNWLCLPNSTKQLGEGRLLAGKGGHQEKQGLPSIPRAWKALFGFKTFPLTPEQSEMGENVCLSTYHSLNPNKLLNLLQ